MSYLTDTPSNVSGMSNSQLDALNNWKKSTYARNNPNMSDYDKFEGTLAEESYRKFTDSAPENSSLALWGEGSGFDFGTDTGTNNSGKGYFDRLLDGDSGALGLAGLGLKGVGMAANLAMLPSMLENAKLQNDLAKQAYASNKYKFDNHKKVTDQLSKISVA